MELKLPHYDIIGDVHGCYDEIFELLLKLNYNLEDFNHPNGHKIIFLGDLIDRGPKNLDVLCLGLDFLETKNAIWLMGNHEEKLLRWLKGNPIIVSDGLDKTIKEIQEYEEFVQNKRFSEKLLKTLESLPYYHYLEKYNLYLAHAGFDEVCQENPESSNARHFALYVRDWAQYYKGNVPVIHGHSPIDDFPIWKNNVLNIDTSCVFGGHLTAISYPSMHITQVKSNYNYLDEIKSQWQDWGKW